MSTTAIITASFSCACTYTSFLMSGCIRLGNCNRTHRVTVIAAVIVVLGPEAISKAEAVGAVRA